MFPRLGNPTNQQKPNNMDTKEKNTIDKKVLTNSFAKSNKKTWNRLKEVVEKQLTNIIKKTWDLIELFDGHWHDIILIYYENQRQ